MLTIYITSWPKFGSVAVGSLGLIKVGDAKAKFGLVNISSKKVDEALAEVGSVPFYPVKLGSTHLQKHLFYTEKSFTDIKQGK